MTKYRIMQDHPDRFYAEEHKNGDWLLVIGTVEPTAERAEAKLSECIFSPPRIIKELEL